MKLKFFKADGTAAGDKEFTLPVFEGDKGIALLKQTIIAYQANKRQGTSKTKDYGEVAGSGKKIKPQKGTGGARHGDRRAPQMYKGGVVFGPRPRDWSKHITTAAKKLALGRALFDLANDGGVQVIESFTVSAPKTKLIEAVIGKIKPTGKILLVDAAWSDNAALSARNIERITLTDSLTLNALDLVKYQTVLFTEQALSKVIARANA